MYTLIVAMMLSVAGWSNAGLAQAIAYVVTHDATPTGWTPELAAAVLVVTAHEESRFGANAKRGDVGMRGRVASVCAFQIAATTEARARLLEMDLIACTRAALAIVRITVDRALCVDAPLAPYCGGCGNAAARAISARRMSAARALAR